MFTRKTVIAPQPTTFKLLHQNQHHFNNMETPQDRVVGKNSEQPLHTPNTVAQTHPSQTGTKSKTPMIHKDMKVRYRRALEQYAAIQEHLSQKNSPTEWIKTQEYLVEINPPPAWIETCDRPWLKFHDNQTPGVKMDKESQDWLIMEMRFLQRYYQIYTLITETMQSRISDIKYLKFWLKENKGTYCHRARAVIDSVRRYPDWWSYFWLEEYEIEDYRNFLRSIKAN